MADLNNIVEVSLKGPQGQATRQIMKERNMFTDREDTYDIVKHIGDYRYMCVFNPEEETSQIYPVHQVFGKVTGLMKMPDDHEDVSAMMETLVTYMENEFSAITWQAYR